MPTSPLLQRLTPSCAQHLLQAISPERIAPQPAGMASPGKTGALPPKAAPSRAADGTVLLQMEGDLGLKLGMELSSEHQAVYMN